MASARRQAQSTRSSHRAQAIAPALTRSARRDMCPLPSPRTRSIQREKRIATSVGVNEATSSEFYELAIRYVLVPSCRGSNARHLPSQSALVSRGLKSGGKPPRSEEHTSEL